ncbi:shematrin-like protein 2 [Oryza brachyantha]|uniref:shematrin-like protein 2 n=1 Tax=Oryza brachyantha TaxID=4533 RepID=UPI001AD9BB01|nr:shematrin-like protein 2 [Oryza brachyantha]
MSMPPAAMAMAPRLRLLIVLSVLFTAGIASAAPGRFPPAYGYGYGGIPPGLFGPGGGGGWGGGYGYGGPGGGYSRGGVEVPTVVCSDKGPCYGKKVACPSKCFWSYSRSGNGYGAGGGGGSCSIDCKTKCTATC